MWKYSLFFACLIPLSSQPPVLLMWGGGAGDLPDIPWNPDLHTTPHSPHFEISDSAFDLWLEWFSWNRPQEELYFKDGIASRFANCKGGRGIECILVWIVSSALGRIGTSHCINYNKPFFIIAAVVLWWKVKTIYFYRSYDKLKYYIVLAKLCSFCHWHNRP